MANTNKTKIILTCTIMITIFVVSFAIILYPEPAHAEKLYEVLANNTGPSATIKNIWNAIKNLVNVLVIAALIFFAFANILRLNVNTYSIKKILPTLIFAVIAANFSFLVCRLVVDAANVVMSLLINGSGAATVGSGTSPASGLGINIQADKIGIAGSFTGNQTTTDLSKSLVDSASKGLSYPGFFKFSLFSITELIGSILILILAFLFYIRNYVIYFLVCLSPLAFMATVLPQTKSVFNQWWSNMLKWTFLPIVALFWLWVGTAFEAVGSLNTNQSIPFLGAAFAGVCYYLAITTPLKMGGGIMSAWSNLGKKTWGATAGNAWKYTGGTTLKNTRQLYGEKLKTWYNESGQSRYNPIGIFARRGARWQEAIKEQQKITGNTADDLTGTVLTGNQRLAGYKNKARTTGGMTAMAEAEIEQAFTQTDAGKKWRTGRLDYLKKLEAIQTENKIFHQKEEEQFITGQGEWEGLESEKAKLRQRALLAKSNAVLMESSLEKGLKKETLRSLTNQVDALKRNQSVLDLRDLQTKITDAEQQGNQEDAAKYTASYNKIKEDFMRTEDINGDTFDQLMAQSSESDQGMERWLAKRIEDQLVDKKLITRDANGKITGISYEMTPVVKLSADGTKIEGLNSFASLGPAARSRLNRALGAAIGDEVTGYTEKYSVGELANMIVEGDPNGDFTAEDSKNIMEGKVQNVDPVRRAYALAARRAFFKAKNSRPDSLDGIEFSSNLTRILTKSQADRFASEAEDLIRKRIIQKTPGITPDRVEEQMERNNTKRRVDDDGTPENADVYLSRLLAGSRDMRSAASSVIDIDPVAGTAKPVTDLFAGVEAGYRYAGSVLNEQQVRNLEIASNELNRTLATTAAKKVGEITTMITNLSKKSGINESEIVDAAHSRIHAAKRETAENFARDIGILSKEGHLTPVDRQMMIEIMKKMRGKTREDIERELATSLKGKYQLTGGQIKLPERVGNVDFSAYASGQADSADRISNAINGMDRLKVSADVSEIMPYVTGLARTVPQGQNVGQTLQNISNQSVQVVNQIEKSGGSAIPQNLAPQIRQVLSTTGHTNESIEGLMSNPDRLSSTLFQTSKAASALSRSVNEQGQINPEIAEERLFDDFTSLERSRRAEEVTSPAQNTAQSAPQPKTTIQDVKPPQPKTT